MKFSWHTSETSLNHPLITLEIYLKLPWNFLKTFWDTLWTPMKHPGSPRETLLKYLWKPSKNLKISFKHTWDTLKTSFRHPGDTLITPLKHLISNDLNTPNITKCLHTHRQTNLVTSSLLELLIKIFFSKLFFWGNFFGKIFFCQFFC